jgi:hypothetical protein
VRFFTCLCGFVRFISPLGSIDKFPICANLRRGSFGEREMDMIGLAVITSPFWIGSILAVVEMFTQGRR